MNSIYLLVKWQTGESVFTHWKTDLLQCCIQLQNFILNLIKKTELWVMFALCYKFIEELY